MTRNIRSPSQHKIWDLTVCFECHLRQLRHSGGKLRLRRPALASSAVNNAEPGKGSMRRSFTSRQSLARATGTSNGWTSPSGTSSRSLTTSRSVSINHSGPRCCLIEYPPSCLLLMASPGTPGPPSQVHLPSRSAEELSRLAEKILYLNYLTWQAVYGVSCVLGLRLREHRSWFRSLEK